MFTGARDPFAWFIRAIRPDEFNFDDALGNGFSHGGGEPESRRLGTKFSQTDSVKLPTSESCHADPPTGGEESAFLIHL